jgi:hypothetical protein
LADCHRRRRYVGQALYGSYDESMSYLIFAAICLSPAIYYRRLWQKSERKLRRHINNQWQWNDWGE